MNARTVAVALVWLLPAAFAQAPAAPPTSPAQTQPAQTQPAQPAPATVGGFNLNNAPLLQVIDDLARELKINYVLDASIKNGSVTVNTFGAIHDIDLRPLLETILRMNNLVMVQAGNIYRIVPVANVARQPISPVSQADPSKIPDDERMVLNLIFLRYATSSEMAKVLQPFVGDGGQLTNYDPANLLIILDNSRNMKRTLELIALFDSDTFAGQRVRAFEVKNGRPSDLAKELEDVFKAYSLGAKDRGAVQFLPINRINTILAVAPNPGAFAEVEKWVAKLDTPTQVTAGSVDNHVYKLKYGRAEILGGVISQLYGIPSPFGYGGYGSGGGFGGGYGIPGNSSYPASGFGGGGYGGGGYGGGGYGGASPYGYGGGGYGGASPYGYGGGGYGGASPYGYGGGYAPQAQTNPLGNFASQQPQPAAATGTATAGGAVPTTAGGATGVDQTGTFLGAGGLGGGFGSYLPRIIPNQFDNTLLVQGTPEQWEQIRNLLEQLDIPPRQVLIDAKIYEVDLTGELSAGVEAFLQQRGAANAAVPGGRQLLGTSNSAMSSALNLSAGLLVGHSRELLALLNAHELSTKAKVLSAPSVIATDSIPASLTVGTSVPTLTSQAVNPGITSGGNSLFTNTISNTSTGIGLNVLARVNPSGVVTLVINQNVTAPVPTTSSAINSPSFSQRNISTQVTVQDGDTIAIGGIIDEKSTLTKEGIPLLSRIPYLGAAFGNRLTTSSRTELIIFLTPRVIYDTNQIADATEELKQKVRGLRKIIKEQ